MTQTQLKEILHYNPDTGIFTWKKDIGYKIKYGSSAGSINKEGYSRIKLYNKEYKTHRLAWLYMTSEFPKNQLDHINHNRSDNRIVNLREVTQRENQKNRSVQKNNMSGIPGVYKNKQTNKWQVSIQVDKKRIFLGCYTNKKEASKVKKEAEVKYGFHENHGKA